MTSPLKKANCFKTFSGPPEDWTTSGPCRLYTRGGTGSGLPELTPAGFCVFLSDPDPGPESKFWGKPDPDPSHFSISTVAGVCVVIS